MPTRKRSPRARKAGGGATSAPAAVAAAARLQESEERYRGVVEQSADWIVIHRGGRMLYVNPATVKAIGAKSAADLIGRSVLDFVHPDSRELVIARMKQAPHSGQLPVVEQRYVRLDGKVLDCEVVARPITYGGEQAVLVSVRDVTERKAAEAERRALEAKIQTAQKQESLAALAAGVAHDFNNLLLGVLGNASLAERDLPEGSPVRERLKGIETAAQRAAELTRQLLVFAGGGTFVLQPIDLGALLREMATLLQVSVTHKITLHFDFEPELPPIRADATQIRQVAMNLLLNAAEAVGDQSGTISVRGRAVDVDAAYLASAGFSDGLVPGRYVLLEVVDSGVGMDDETCARIFEPFYSTKRGGRGLGLASVLGIVRGHKGAIRVRSGRGLGTTFGILLPTARRRREQPVEVTARPMVARAAASRTGTVLVADDEDAVRTVAVVTLQQAGYRVVTASDGRGAVEAFRTNAKEIVAVLLDLTMPGLSGREVSETLRTIKTRVPIILSSGYRVQDAREELSGRGPTAFLQKPYQPSELVAALDELLGRDEAARAPSA
ncbi:MAG: PAS domain S-box protein [Deltaproteobacteria bacterium]|nr:PAS domain S-box protein [Deltaproteobacteria bacterium]